MSNEIESTEVPATQALRATRKRWLLLVGGAFALIALAYGVYWTLALRYMKAAKADAAAAGAH